jgi:hypothetical protein
MVFGDIDDLHYSQRLTTLPEDASQMRGDGPFSSRNDAFADFLSNIGGGTDIQYAFPARNFLNDEGVQEERCRSYEASGSVAYHADCKTWRQVHDKYLKERVQVSRNDAGALHPLDPDDLDVFPETFRFIDGNSPFLRTDMNMMLVRVEELDFISDKSGVSKEEIKALAKRVIASRSSHSASHQALDDILEQWSTADRVDARPVFSGFWADVEDLFVPTERDDWADQMRNRLGLLHLNPAKRLGPISVIVFRYRVRDIPKLPGTPRNTAPLVPPTVLDSALSSAFCPAPPGNLNGQTLDLACSGSEPCGEVLHPVIQFKAEDIWRIGEIQTSVTDDTIRNAREWHMLCLRDITGRPEYARDTDP